MSKYKDFAETPLTAQEAYVRGGQDFNFFAGLCIPHIIRYAFPPLYVQLWTLIVTAIAQKDKDTATRIIRYALGLPRGFAKTTFLKILCAWLIVYDQISFLLLIGSTESLAQNFISDLNEILGSRNIEAVYGAWTVNLAIDNREEKKAIYRGRTVIIHAAGAGTSVRGLNLAHERPDFLLCDDMQTKENAKSDTESANLLEWFTGTLLKVVDPFFATVVYCGNMYPLNCILAKLQENPQWTTVVTGSILADKKSLWEEVKPVEALMMEFYHDEALGLGHVWFAEMMNQPIYDKISLLPHGTLPPAPFLASEFLPDSGVAVIDPAGLKKGSDDNVVTFFHIRENLAAVVKLIAGATDTSDPILTPLEVINATVKYCLILGIQVIAIEDVAYQSTLSFWFQDVLRRQGLENHFHFIPVSPRGQQKERRITTSVKSLLERSWFFLDDTARQRYIFQALAFKIGKKSNTDDILDCCSYLEELRRPEHWSIIKSIPINGAFAEEGILCGAETPF